MPIKLAVNALSTKRSGNLHTERPVATAEQHRLVDALAAVDRHDVVATRDELKAPRLIEAHASQVKRGVVVRRPYSGQ